MGFDMSGLAAGLRRAEQQFTRAAREAETDAAEHVLEAADIPRNTGALAASGHVDGASVVFDVNYAVEVHEYEDPFLERAVVGERSRVGAIMADRIRRVT